MKCNKLGVYIRLCKTMLLGGIILCFSCCVENIIETEKKTSDSVVARSTSFSSSLTDFFSYSCYGLDSVINTLKHIDKERNFSDDFLKEYGIPLWNYTLMLKNEDEAFFYVPIYQGKSFLSIDVVWFFYITDGKIIYAPFRRTDERIKNHEQRFVFDLLSWRIFGECNASGLVFREKESSSRVWIVVDRCWDVYTGTKGNMEYKYTNCVHDLFWVDETVYWLTTVPEDELSGGSAIVGGGSGGSGTSAGSSSASASDIFCNDNFNDVSWDMADYLLEDILDNCMGEALFNGIKEKLNGDKIKIRFIENEASSYNWNDSTLSLSTNQLESNVLFHEMFHLYQTLSESQSTFENSLMNREIEAHYAQFLFLKHQSPLWNVETNYIYQKNERLRACRLIEDYVDDNGIIRDGVGQIDLDLYLEFSVTDVFRDGGYNNYPFNNEAVGQTFNVVKELTKNCKP